MALKKICFGASLFMLLIFLGCTMVPKIASKRPHIRGQIMNIRGDEFMSGFRVEGKDEPDTQFDVADVVVTDNTKFYIKRGNNYENVSSNEIKVGQIVEVLFTGPRQLSYPIQAVASEVVIVEQQVP
jgi:hypothetical protein